MIEWSTPSPFCIQFSLLWIYLPNRFSVGIPSSQFHHHTYVYRTGLGLCIDQFELQHTPPPSPRATRHLNFWNRCWTNSPPPRQDCWSNARPCGRICVQMSPPLGQEKISLCWFIRLIQQLFFSLTTQFFCLIIKVELNTSIRTQLTKLYCMTWTKMPFFT